MTLVHLPFLSLVHFPSSSALGSMAVLSAKAIAGMRREDRKGSPQA